MRKDFEPFLQASQPLAPVNKLRMEVFRANFRRYPLSFVGICTDVHRFSLSFVDIRTNLQKPSLGSVDLRTDLHGCSLRFVGIRSDFHGCSLMFVGCSFAVNPPMPRPAYVSTRSNNTGAVGVAPLKRAAAVLKRNGFDG